MLKPLPIGIYTFSDIIKGNYLYVDKTNYIFNLVKDYKGVYFLSRPRRFGKSLLISTLNEIFKGNKELFNGLWIYNSDYEWKQYPVIRVDFSKQKVKSSDELEEFLLDKISEIGMSYGITLTKNKYYSRFDELILQLSKKERVVVLIDEYDKPILDNITNVKVAVEIREILKGFYTIIKAMDEHLRFVFLTGISKFSKAGVFSGLNHLNDITIDRAYSTMLGITEDELKINFTEYIDEFSKNIKLSKQDLLEKIRYWYNGYCFFENCKNVYNPYSTLLLFEKNKFQNFWFESGTPSFLVNLIKNTEFDIYDVPITVDQLSFSTYEVDDLDILPLLFQTGYLTIKEYNSERNLYILDYPNYEVKSAFLERLIKNIATKKYSETFIYSILDSLKTPDFEQFFSNLKSFFAGIPYDIQIKQERYYQTLFYLIFTLLGLKTEVEVKTNIGRIDTVVNDDSIFIFEFKMDGSKEEAMKQIKEKRYYEKYLSLNKPIYLIGASFAERNIKDWVVEEYKK